MSPRLLPQQAIRQVSLVTPPDCQLPDRHPVSVSRDCRLSAMDSVIFGISSDYLYEIAQIKEDILILSESLNCRDIMCYTTIIFTRIIHGSP